MNEPRDRDVLIIGAGLSGIGMACHLCRELPELSYTVLERRQRVGGTWDLFRYPGVRSDSDMFTLGFPFRPWTDSRVLAEGADIRRYIEETASEYGVDDNICFGLKVTRASWCSQRARWQVSALDEASGEEQIWTCRFLVLGTGYYRYDAGYQPDFPGSENFRGQLIHPQHWPEDLDYAGKRVVVIGSGATAVTLVPAMSKQAAQVTMLQRSPTYIMSLPATDRITELMKRWLPESWVFGLTRWRNVALARWLYVASQRWPNAMSRFYLNGVRRHLKKDVDMRHFRPSYKPWDQRLCAVPDGDLFEAINANRAQVVTAEMECFTETGIRLRDGQELAADIVVSATGLDLQMMGGMTVEVDGVSREPQEVMSYKAVMIDGVPNFGVLFGYTNATWTLKADIAARYLCRLMRHMRRNGYASACPMAPQGMVTEASAMDALNSGYVRRAADRLPRQGRELPWKVLNHYRRDRRMLLHEPLEDGVLQFAREGSAGKADKLQPAA